jgi:hypothetical protein
MITHGLKRGSGSIQPSSPQTTGANLLERLRLNLNQRLVQLKHINSGFTEHASACTTNKPQMNASVMVNYANSGDWYQGRVVRIYPSGNVDVEYEDGDYEEDVPKEMFQNLLDFIPLICDSEVSSDSDSDSDDEANAPKHIIGVESTAIEAANKDLSIAPWASLHIKADAITKTHCDTIISEVEAVADRQGCWGGDRHAFHATQDLEIGAIPALADWFTEWTEKTVFPCLREIYCLGPRKKILVDDAFIVKYSMEGQKSLTLHSDMSELSFVVPLNASTCYEGGGTYFRTLDQTIKPESGSALFFCGKWKHSGVQITSGTRYILAGFLQLKSRRATRICTEIEADEDRLLALAQEEKANETLPEGLSS